LATKKKYVSVRESRAQATREKLLEAAIELVNQYGMKYLTVRNICEEAGLSTGSFYNLFDSKDDLVFYYLQNVFTTYKQKAEEDASDYSSLEKVALIYRFYIQCVLETGLEFITGLYAANTNPTFNFLERDPESEMVLDRVKDYLIEGKSSGEIRSDVDINTALLRIGVIITGNIYYWCVFEGRIDLASHTDAMLQDYLRSLATDKDVQFTLEALPVQEGSLI
jgi:AcrR family transcriptional regulator